MVGCVINPALMYTCQLRKLVIGNWDLYIHYYINIYSVQLSVQRKWNGLSFSLSGQIIFFELSFFFLGKFSGQWPSAAGKTTDVIYHILQLRICLQTLASYIVAWRTSLIFHNAGSHVHCIWFTCPFSEGIQLDLRGFFVLTLICGYLSFFLELSGFCNLLSEGVGKEWIQHCWVGSLYYKSRILRGKVLAVTWENLRSMGGDGSKPK